MKSHHRRCFADDVGMVRKWHNENPPGTQSNNLLKKIGAPSKYAVRAQLPFTTMHLSSSKKVGAKAYVIDEECVLPSNNYFGLYIIPPTNPPNSISQAMPR